jgi:histidinol phosphatase-like enzyme (inositol monophosphatase family)
MSGDLRELLAIAKRAAELAGEVIMPIYRREFEVETKADGTPVTAADRAAEEAVRAFLQRECPGHGILGEEFPELPGDGRHRWILDPIDGTKSFIHHVPLWGSLIALERDGRPVVGVIACHGVGETVSAAEGMGAELNGRPVHVSKTATLAEATVSLTSYARVYARDPRGFAELCARAGLTRAWGDCYGYLMVASGRADVMLDPEMSLWDVAALYPVITEAGGRITTWEGEDRVGESSIATNGLLHEEILGLFRGEGPGG